MKILWLLMFISPSYSVQMHFDSHKYCEVVRERLADQYRDAKVTCEEIVLKQT